jgi:cytochrome b6
MRKGIVFNTLEFLAERFPIEKANFHSMVTKKTVPIHRMSWAYYAGGLTLFFFIVQVVTGLLLLFYYQPTVSDAHASVEYITSHVPFGAVIRNMHAWSSSCMIFCVLSHFVTTMAMKAFHRPRELTWLSGVLLLLVTFVFGFTGYLLPWHQIAVNATKVGLQSIELMGAYLPGELSKVPTIIRETIQGEPAVGQSTLSRFYALHVIILPFTVFAVLGLHLFSVQLHGMSAGVDEPPKRHEKFMPFFVIKDLGLWGFAFLLLVTAALCVPFESFFSFPLFAPYDALGSTPEGIKPEWYFYFVYYPLELLPFWVVALGQTVVVGALFAAPWLFKHSSRKTMTVLASCVASFMIVITLFGHMIYEFFKGGR